MQAENLYAQEKKFYLNADILPYDAAKYPHYALESRRKKSFPEDKKINIDYDLWKYGFFYAGWGDVVICFYCGLILTGWRKTDIPFVEHKKVDSNCLYLKLNHGVEEWWRRFRNHSTKDSFHQKENSKILGLPGQHHRRRSGENISDFRKPNTAWAKGRTPLELIARFTFIEVEFLQIEEGLLIVKEIAFVNPSGTFAYLLRAPNSQQYDQKTLDCLKARNGFTPTDGNTPYSDLQRLITTHCKVGDDMERPREALRRERKWILQEEDMLNLLILVLNVDRVARRRVKQVGADGTIKPFHSIQEGGKAFQSLHVRGMKDEL
ncbi:putative apoptosis inhibitor ORF99 [Nymphon striatum]|nr:putative apoptosis inhibitor ORF99 [Nymphon striatum]